MELSESDRKLIEYSSSWFKENGEILELEKEVKKFNLKDDISTMMSKMKLYHSKIKRPKVKKLSSVLGINKEKEEINIKIKRTKSSHEIKIKITKK